MKADVATVLNQYSPDIGDFAKANPNRISIHVHLKANFQKYEIFRHAGQLEYMLINL